MSTRELPTAAVGRPAWLRSQERGSALAVRFIVWLALLLGRPVMRRLLTPICCYFLIFSVRARVASRAYLTQALGRHATVMDVYRHYSSFASCVLDRVYLLKGGIDRFNIEIHGEEIVNNIASCGTGCILLGAHIGSFEVLRAIGRRRPDVRVRMVMFQENAQKVSRVLNALNPELAQDIITLGQLGTFVTIRDALEAGNFVGLLADRGLTEEAHVVVPFLGRPARFPGDPIRMTAILGKPVVLMIGLHRGGNRYEIHFERFTAAEALPRRPSPAEIQDCVRQYVERLEHYCRLAPYNWFNFYDVWDRP